MSWNAIFKFYLWYVYFLFIYVFSSLTFAFIYFCDVLVCVCARALVMSCILYWNEMDKDDKCKTLRYQKCTCTQTHTKWAKIDWLAIGIGENLYNIVLCVTCACSPVRVKVFRIGGYNIRTNCHNRIFMHLEELHLDYESRLFIITLINVVKCCEQ